jgi:hypothetical protein
MPHRQVNPFPTQLQSQVPSPLDSFAISKELTLFKVIVFPFTINVPEYVLPSDMYPLKVRFLLTRS